MKTPSRGRVRAKSMAGVLGLDRVVGRAVTSLHPCSLRCLGVSLEDETNLLLVLVSDVSGCGEVAVSLGLAVCFGA
jgi:hypothetical protein